MDPDRPTLPVSLKLRPDEVPARRPRSFRLAPDAEARAALAPLVGAVALPVLVFEGSLAATSRDELVLEARLTATAVQACIVTLAPVTTEVDERVARRYLAGLPEPTGDEVEMPEDTDNEPMPSSLDLAEVMAEALALTLPLYPRAAGAEAPVPEPSEPETHRPFAGLAGLLKPEPPPEK